jgi:hypothetical protein
LTAAKCACADIGVATAAAAALQVIDLISLKPFDMETISKSIKKTRKALIVRHLYHGAMRTATAALAATAAVAALPAVLYAAATGMLLYVCLCVYLLLSDSTGKANPPPRILAACRSRSA